MEYINAKFCDNEERSGLLASHCSGTDKTCITFKLVKWSSSKVQV